MVGLVGTTSTTKTISTERTNCRPAVPNLVTKGIFLPAEAF
jgi:hypothetical protein